MDLTAYGFGASLIDVLPELRAQAESLMVDQCVVRRPTGHTAQDPDTGSEVPEYADVFVSPCKVQARTLVALEAEVGGRTSTTVRLELHMPLDVPLVKAYDVAEIVDSHDPQLVGRKFTITAPVAKSLATARRFEVSEVVA